MQEKIPLLDVIHTLARASEALASQIEDELLLSDPKNGEKTMASLMPSGEIKWQNIM